MTFDWIVIIVCAVLWRLGGEIKGRIRDVGVPIILGIYTPLFLPFDIFTKIPLIILTIGSFNVIRLGYGNYEEGDPEQSTLATFIHDKNGWWIRAVWGLIVGIIGPIFIMLYCHRFFPLYFFINVLINYMVSRLRLNVWIAEPLVGIGVSSIVLYV
jgi:hypothetical protein